MQKNKKTIYGTSEYLAPEILLKMSYGKSVDWWSLGSIVYEMLVGKPPFNSNNKQDLFDKIKMQNPIYDSFLSKSAVDFISVLLRKDFTKRLGFKNGATNVKNHVWFESIHWSYLGQKKYDPPFIPKITSDLGLHNFDVEFTEMTIDSPLECTGGTNHNKHYSDFSWSLGKNLEEVQSSQISQHFQINLEPTIVTAKR